MVQQNDSGDINAFVLPNEQPFERLEVEQAFKELSTQAANSCIYYSLIHRTNKLLSGIDIVINVPLLWLCSSYLFFLNPIALKNDIA